MSCTIDQHFKRNQDYKIQDLAHYAGTSPQMIYKILNSESKPNIYLAMKICDFFTILNARMKRKGFDSFSGKIRLHVDDLWIFDQMSLEFNDSS